MILGRVGKRERKEEGNLIWAPGALDQNVLMLGIESHFN